jgi:hypothetical protein
VLWSAWFGVYGLGWSLAWDVELWAGSTVFAALGAAGLGLLAFDPPEPSPSGEELGQPAEEHATR